MRLRNILSKNAIIDDLKSLDKKGVLQEFSDLVTTLHSTLDTQSIYDVLLNREKLGSTGVGNGVAIPHGKVSGLDQIFAAFGRSKKGINFQSHDQKATYLFFVLLAPENAIGNHLQALARLSRLLKEEHIREKLMKCQPEELYEILISEDEKI